MLHIQREITRSFERYNSHNIQSLRGCGARPGKSKQGTASFRETERGGDDEFTSGGSLFEFSFGLP